jgi:hypothetical protein
LQAEASARVSGLANVLFCALVIHLSLFFHCKITTVVSFLGLLVTVACMKRWGLRAAILSIYTELDAG